MELKKYIEILEKKKELQFMKAIENEKTNEKYAERLFGMVASLEFAINEAKNISFIPMLSNVWQQGHPPLASEKIKYSNPVLVRLTNDDYTWIAIDRWDGYGNYWDVYHHEMPYVTGWMELPNIR